MRVFFLKCNGVLRFAYNTYQVQKIINVFRWFLWSLENQFKLLRHLYLKVEILLNGNIIHLIFCYSKNFKLNAQIVLDYCREKYYL